MSLRRTSSFVSSKFWRACTSRTAATSADPSSSLWLLQYDYVGNILTKRVPHRAAHLALAQTFKANGSLLQGGPYSTQGYGWPGLDDDHVDGAVFLFQKQKIDPDRLLQDFVLKDPYVVHELVTKYYIRHWHVSV